MILGAFAAVVAILVLIVFIAICVMAVDMALGDLEFFPRLIKRGWHPGHEKPEVRGDYIVTCATADGYRYVTCMYFSGVLWLISGARIDDCKVLAWMPAPEPYKGDADHGKVEK